MFSTQAVAVMVFVLGDNDAVSEGHNAVIFVGNVLGNVGVCVGLVGLNVCISVGIFVGDLVGDVDANLNEIFGRIFVDNVADIVFTLENILSLAYEYLEKIHTNSSFNIATNLK
eukprot:443552_1